jgi:maltooligosyltrehalose trehalohydrolase
MAPHVPMLFQGEEWGAPTPFPYFVDVADPDLAQAIRDGRRREFSEAGWHGAVPDPVDPATFTAAVLRWDELASGEHAALLAWHRDLHALRRAHRHLRDGGFAEVTCNEATGALAVVRGPLTLLVNLAAEPRRRRVVGALALASHRDVVRESGDLVLPPESCAIVIAG